ncbi:hypothetical protein AAAA58_24520, partial [Escherichia coli]|uniref:hypothetical protein n=1 Tax=Escherichia coli TaxID=562 RepID=UPI0034D727DA
MRPKPAAGVRACGHFCLYLFQKFILGTRGRSIIQSPHETTVTAVEKPECTLHCKHFRDEVKMN